MTRYHATFNGKVPFSPEEEAEWDLKEQPSETSNLNLLNYQESLVRDKRNVELQKSDWMACSDVTMTDEWKAYRQELRDVPQDLDFPDKFIDEYGSIILPASPTD